MTRRRPTVSDLFDGIRHPRIVAVYVPIVRDGEVRYVMSAALPMSTFSAVLHAQPFAKGSVATLQDRQHVVLARTRAEEETVGRRAEDPTLGHEGWVRSHQRDGQDVYVAFATAPLSGWRIVITSTVASVEAPLRRALGQLLVGGAVAAALASALAFVFGRRIAGAVGSLVRIARAVERGQRAQPLRTGVTEVNVLAEQLRAAADRARKREEEAAAREHQARAIGEVAHALNASPDLDAVLRSAVEAVHNLVHADSARIALVEEAGRLVLRYSTQASTAMRPGFVIERGHGIGGLALATGRPVRTDDFMADPRFRADRYISLARMDGIVSCVAVPIVTADGVVGVIYANNFTLRPFSALDEAALVRLADHTAVAVQKTRLLDAEHAARSEAEAANRGKDELLAMLGHELRNPLAAIANATHVLGVPHAPAEATRRAREIIARQNAHLAHLVDDLLDVARVTSGKIVLSRRPLELAEAVRRAVGTLTTSGRTEQHRVSLLLEPVWADVDETRWEQVVTNLVGNALRFTPAGGTVDITLEAPDGDAVLRVRDSGMGIAPDVLPRVFDLFVQGDSRRRGRAGRPRPGAHARPADHRAARRDGRGRQRGARMRQRVHRPAARDRRARRPGAHARPGAERSAPAPRHRGGQRGHPADAALRPRALAGHEVHDAIDGPGGLEAIMRVRPDVALIDIGLPEFDGYEVARKVRGALGGTILLVALTGYGQPDDRRQALEAGFDAHLVKPVEPGALLGVIQAAIR